MRNAAMRHTKNRVNTSQSGNTLEVFAKFYNVFDYKGEHCFSCGHSWSEKGNLHYKHCRFYVSEHQHNQHKN